MLYILTSIWVRCTPNTAQNLLSFACGLFVLHRLHLFSTGNQLSFMSNLHLFRPTMEIGIGVSGYNCLMWDSNLGPNTCDSSWEILRHMLDHSATTALVFTSFSCNFNFWKRVFTSFLGCLYDYQRLGMSPKKLFFASFFIILASKFCKIVQKTFKSWFQSAFGCTGPKCWSKYTAQLV